MNAEIRYFDETGSTNELCTRAAREGAPGWTVFLANCQTSGHGRRGRGWSSPAGMGLWTSVLLRPELPVTLAGLIPLAAALAVAEAVRTVTDLSCGIKWPNDVILDGKKLSGILCESRSRDGQIEYVTVGIGVNLRRGAYPPDLTDRAVSLEEHLAFPPERETLLEAILSALERRINQLKEGRGRALLNDYEKQCLTVGAGILVSGAVEMTGVATGIGEDGSLLIRGEDGTVRTVACGDVSVRGVMGYV